MGSMSRVLYNSKVSDVYDIWVGSGYYNYEELADNLVKILVKRKNLLELGIGTGNMAIPLLKRGFKVEGIEPSKFMIKKLEEKLKTQNLSVPTYLQDIENLKLPNNYDAAFSVGGPFWLLTIGKEIYIDTYVQKKDVLVNSLKNIAKVLKPGGLLTINIQHHGTSFRNRLADGSEYHFVIKQRDSTHINKTHFFERDGKLLFKVNYPIMQLPEKQVIQCFNSGGFESLGPDSTNSFWLFKKIYKGN